METAATFDANSLTTFSVVCQCAGRSESAIETATRDVLNSNFGNAAGT